MKRIDEYGNVLADLVIQIPDILDRDEKALIALLMDAFAKYNAPYLPTVLAWAAKRGVVDELKALRKISNPALKEIAIHFCDTNLVDPPLAALATSLWLRAIRSSCIYNLMIRDRMESVTCTARKDAWRGFFGSSAILFGSDVGRPLQFWCWLKTYGRMHFNDYPIYDLIRNSALILFSNESPINTPRDQSYFIAQIHGRWGYNKTYIAWAVQEWLTCCANIKDYTDSNNIRTNECHKKTEADILFTLNDTLDAHELIRKITSLGSSHLPYWRRAAAMNNADAYALMGTFGMRSTEPPQLHILGRRCLQYSVEHNSYFGRLLLTLLSEEKVPHLITDSLSETLGVLC